MHQALINGQWHDEALLWDRGLFYGDGLFETISLTQGGMPLLELHLDRLFEGCRRLALPAPDEIRLRTELDLVARQARAPAVIKLVYTRGPGERGYRLPTEPRPTRILYCSEWPTLRAAHWRSGIVVRICQLQLARQPALAGLKTLNRLEQVLARAEWHDEAIQEGIMCDTQGNVVEGTMSNVFVVTQGELITPALDQCGVAGVMRRKVMEVAGTLGIPCGIRQFRLDTLKQAEELFVTNSLIGIWPVRQLEQQSFEPGPITRQLQNQISQYLPNHEVSAV